jgi:crotonobetaine/carnitine-CoA ligase
VSLREAAEAFGDRELIVWVGTTETTTYRQMYDHASRWAGLLVGHGVARGDRVILMLHNNISFVGAYFGAQFLGGIAVPLNTELRGESLRRPLQLFEPTVVVVDASLADVLATAMADMERPPEVVVVGAGDSVAGLRDALALAPEPADDSTPCLIMSTSGTTGPPKGSVWSHGTVRQWAVGYRRHLRYGSDDRIYCCTPLFHANSLIAGLMTAVETGCAVVLASRFSVRRFWPDVVATESTSANLIGSMIQLLLNGRTEASEAQRAEARLSRVLASSCPAALQLEMQQTWGLSPVTAYGLTDFGTLTSGTHGEPIPPGSCGRAVDEFELRLVDAADRDVADNVPGELVARPRKPWIVPQEYFRMPEETLASRRNLWFHTGDLLRRDEDGWFYFAGRVKDSMRRRGENVSAFEVEIAAVTCSLVAEAAAYPVPSDEGEDEIALAVVLADARTPLDVRVLFDHMARELPYFAVPRYVRVVAELPKTPTQKIQKNGLAVEGITEDMQDRVVLGLEVARNTTRMREPDGRH